MELVQGKLYFYLYSVWRENASGGRSTGDLIVNLDNLHKHTKSAKHFGPPVLKTIWEHCNRVDSTRKSGRVYFLTNDKEDNLHTEHRTLSAFLMGAYAILRLGWDIGKTNDALLASIPKKLAFFRDYHGDSNFKLNILDCLRALNIGCNINRWFLTKYSSNASRIYDMDWIVPNKLLALRDPTIHRETRRRSVSKVAVRELKRCGITSIVRLNGNDSEYCLNYYGYSYEVEEIQREHFKHYEIPFEDVNIPTLDQVNEFINFCEASDARIAVHCHAGLGRSAAMIGCYMIKHYGFDGRSVCAWMKMCRSGSVMGPQHFFFERYEQFLSLAHNPEVSVRSSYRSDTANNTAKQIRRPPKKNNIIHIVPSTRNKKATSSQQSKTSQQKDTGVNASSAKKKRNSLTSGQTITQPTGKSVLGHKSGKRLSRTSQTSKLISTVIQTPTVTPPNAKQSRKDISLKPYRIPTCYVKLKDSNSYKKVSEKTQKSSPVKGPTYMKGSLSKSHEQLQTVQSQRSHHQPNQHTGMITRTMKKNFETFGSYRRR